MRSIVVFFYLALLLTVATLKAQVPLSVSFELSESTDRIRIDFSMKNVSASLQRVDWFFEICDPWILVQGKQPALLNHEMRCNLDDSYQYIILPAGDSVSAFIDLNKKYIGVEFTDSLKVTFTTLIYEKPSFNSGADWYTFTETFYGLQEDLNKAMLVRFNRTDSAEVDSVFSAFQYELIHQAEKIHFLDGYMYTYRFFSIPSESYAEIKDVLSQTNTIEMDTSLFRFNALFSGDASHLLRTTDMILDDSYLGVLDHPFRIYSNNQFTPVSTPESKELVHQMTINSIYPNPFNAATTLSFSLGEAGLVRLDIYNIQGQKVLSFPALQMGQGQHSQQINMVSLNTGIYIIRLQHNNSVLSRKVQYLK